MTDRPDCIHQLDLCPACRGLRVTKLNRLDGVEDVTINAGPFSYSGPSEIYIGPMPGRCDIGPPSREQL